MNKDWVGNSNSVYKTLGSSNHTDKIREVNDYYATEPKAASLLLELESFTNIWECACGSGSLSEIFNKYYPVRSSDIIDRGYGEVYDFLSITNTYWNGDIITNPPYSSAQFFVEKSLQIIPIGNKIAMFLKLQFMEGKGRKSLFLNYPPKTIYVSSSRLLCAKNNNFKESDSSAVAYAWYIWVKGFKGITELKWIN